VRNKPGARAATAGAIICSVLVLGTACSSSPGAAHHPSTSSPGTSTAGGTATASPSAAAGPQLTPAQAKRAFTAFFPRYTAMVKDHTAAQVSSLTLGAQAQVAAFGAAKKIGLAPTAQKSARFYVPQVTTYPRWFVEVGATRSGGASGGDAFVMVQSQPGSPWRAVDTLSWTGSAPAQLAGISVNSQGYATAVPPSDTALVTPPGQLPSQYTQLVAGTGGASARYVPGDPTTEWAAVQQQIVRGAPAQGWRVSFGYTVPAGSEYALRTSSGGAVVFFAFSQSSIWQSRSSSPKFSGGATAFNGRMPISLAVDAGLSTLRPKVGTKIASTYVFEPLALDPAQGSGKISLMDHELDGGGLSSATTG
jgi:hypothetical protein